MIRAICVVDHTQVFVHQNGLQNTMKFQMKLQVKLKPFVEIVAQAPHCVFWDPVFLKHYLKIAGVTQTFLEK